MPSQEDRDNQRELLATHRRNLALYLKQQAELGTANIPPSIANGIREAPDNIRYIKGTLRSWGITVEDLPFEEKLSPSGSSSGKQPIPARTQDSESVAEKLPSASPVPFKFNFQFIAGIILAVVLLSSAVSFLIYRGRQ